jgi:hypothetical protein
MVYRLNNAITQTDNEPNVTYNLMNQGQDNLGREYWIFIT